MHKLNSLGVKMVLGTVGESGSYVLYDNNLLYQPSLPAKNIKDTMGAGDAYFSAFLVSLLKSTNGHFLNNTDSNIEEYIKKAMYSGAAFAAEICGMEGAFGYGIPII